MKSLRITLATTIALSASSAFAQNAPVAVRATIEGVAADGTSLNVRTRAGEERAVHLNAKTRFVLVVPAAIADVKPGAYIGVAALPGEGDQLRAMEVHIFPEAFYEATKTLIAAPPDHPHRRNFAPVAPLMLAGGLKSLTICHILLHIADLNAVEVLFGGA